MYTIKAVVRAEMPIMIFENKRKEEKKQLAAFWYYHPMILAFQIPCYFFRVWAELSSNWVTEDEALSHLFDFILGNTVHAQNQKNKIK